MANNETNVSYIVIGLGIFDLDQELNRNTDYTDIHIITQRVQDKIKEDPAMYAMKTNHTITKDNPELIKIIKTEYNNRIKENENNRKQRKITNQTRNMLETWKKQESIPEQESIPIEIKSKVNMIRMLWDRLTPNQHNRSSTNNPILVQETAFGGSKKRRSTRRGRRGQSRRRRSRRP
jgi:hypothetical protein